MNQDNPKVPTAAALAGFVFFLAQWFIFRSFFPDDLFITLTYAKNILAGGGWSFNSGQPSNGVTSPLWLLLTVTMGFLFRDLYLSVKLLSWLCGLGVLFVTLSMLNRAPGDRIGKASFFLAACLAHWLAFWSSSGMEAGLSALIFSVVVMLNVFGARNWDQQRIVAVSLTLLVVNAYVRPETVLLLGAYGGVMLLRNPGGSWKPTLLVAALAALLGGAWVAFSLHQFGSVIPNTVLIKQGKHFVAERFVVSLMRALGILAPEIGAGLVAGAACWWGRSGPPATRVPGFNLAWAAMALSLPALYVYNGSRGGHWATSRYLLPVLPMFGFFVFNALVRRPGLRILKLGAAGVFVAVNLVLAALHVEPSRHNMEYMNLLKDYAVWLREHTPTHASVAAEDYGVLAFFGGREIVDLVGLNYPEVLGYEDRWRFLERARPDYVLVNEFHEPAVPSKAEQFGDVVLSRDLAYWSMVLTAPEPPVRKLKLVRLRWDGAPARTKASR